MFGYSTLTNITADGVTVTTCAYTWVSVIIGVGEGFLFNVPFKIISAHMRRASQ